MRVLLVSGSAGERPHTIAVLSHLAGLLEARGAETVLWDLRQRPLPKSEVAAADAVVLGTPTYHSSFSGLLKSALDDLPYDTFKDKPVGLVANAGGVRGCMVPCEHLRSVVRAMSGYAANTQVGTCDQDYEPGSSGPRLVAEPVLRRCEALAGELLAMASAFASLKAAA